MAWYRTGTISVSNGSPVVNGLGVNWTSPAVKPGYALEMADGTSFEILELNGSSQLTLAENFMGATNASAPYKIVPTAGANVDLHSKISDLLDWAETEQFVSSILDADVKAAPANSDSVGIVDSEDDNKLKQVSMAALRAMLVGGMVVSGDNFGFGADASNPGRLVSLISPLPVLQIADSSQGSTANDGLLIHQSGVNTIIENTENGYVAIRANATEHVRVSPAGKVIVGATSVVGNETLRVNGSFRCTSDGSGVGFYYAGAFRDVGGSGNSYIDLNSGGAAGNIIFRNGSGFAQQMRLNSIGDLTVGGTVSVGKIGAYTGTNRYQAFSGLNGDLEVVTSNNSNPAVYIKGTGTADLLQIFDDTNQVVTVKDGGNLLVGKTTSAIGIAGTAIRGDNPGLINSVRNGTILELNRLITDGSVVDILKDGTVVTTLGTQKSGFGTSAPTGDGTTVQIHDASNAYSTLHMTNSGTGALITDGTYLQTSGPNFLIRNRENGYVAFYTNNIERSRFLSGGAQVWGGTSEGAASSVSINPAGYIWARRVNAAAAYFDRTNADGQVIELRRDGNAKAHISLDGSRMRLDSNGRSFYLASSNFFVGSDNALNLGHANFRWGTVYATNSTINTSDEREKTDIRSLTRAEFRVAKSIKPLLKAYRWKEDVERIGADAKVHFGAIAQEVVSAFSAEGLNASDYAMVTHDYWFTDEAGMFHEEQNEDGTLTQHDRMGIRYPELLAFIIAAS